MAMMGQCRSQVLLALAWFYCVVAAVVVKSIVVIPY